MPDLRAEQNCVEDLEPAVLLAVVMSLKNKTVKPVLDFAHAADFIPP